MRAQLVLRDAARVREVEAQSIGCDERARLLDVRAQNLPERGVEQVRRGVIAPDRIAARGVDRRGDVVACRQPAVGDTDLVHARPAGRDPRHVLDTGSCGRTGQRAGVGHLAAGLDIERRARQHDKARLALSQRLRLPTRFVEQRDDLRIFRCRCRIAVEHVRGGEQRRTGSVAGVSEAVDLLRLERAGRPSALALDLHGAVEPLAIDGQTALGGQVLDEVDRHTQRVVEAEHVLAGDDPRSRRGAIEHLLESGEAVGQHRVETLFLGSHRPDDGVAVRAQLGVDASHLGDQDVDEAVQTPARSRPSFLAWRMARRMIFRST